MPRSDWLPSSEKLPKTLHDLIRNDRYDLKRHFGLRNEVQNLSQSEVAALRELTHDNSIVIKRADKGSAVVILSRDKYVAEACRQLKDETYYRELDGPIYPQTIPVVSRIIDDLYIKKFITKKQSHYLKGTEQPRERRFYMLPKIHKEPEKWNPPFVTPPGRPIVSDCNSETYYTAEYIDHFLNPLSVKHPSYVKDTYHFIAIVKSLKVPVGSLFFTIDIDSLYTNIDTKSGLAAVQKIFEKYPNSKRPDKELLELLEINLTKNDFVFDSKYYLQIKGTAMGKRFAPAYANIFMANWEEGVLAKCVTKPLHYLRYLDDIWGIWTGSRLELEQFMETLNSHDPSITIKYEINEKTVDFLDTTVYKGPTFESENKLEVKVFFKKTHTHALLFKTSFHPKHTFKGLIKSQVLRFYRICTRKEDFWVAVKTLFKALRKRGYSRSFLRRCLTTFQERREEKESEVLPLITNFSSMACRVNSLVKANFAVANGESNLLPQHKIVSAYRRHKNLNDFLVRAKLRANSHQTSNRTPTYFCKLTFIRNQSDKRLFPIVQKIDSRTSNCVYVIFCSKCGKQYIGETKNSIATRMWQHKYNILNERDLDSPLVQHFMAHGWPSVRVAGIQKNFSWTDYERKTVERKWIYLLTTIEPFGLNRKNAGRR
ncbi:hypothetical protein JOB18_004098 [Solea senegalensis]|uniref:Reverse transcriptase n=1 Tax=Solea senegalensis TaxID=28829 RepID=A0AAV6RHI0_SOLSE|nr:hypothetical protein JOB18_004098 [Solea senegalensis]